MFLPNSAADPKSGIGVLLAVAAPGEADAIRRALGSLATDNHVACAPWAIESLAPGVGMVVTGVGKAQAAGGAAWAIATAQPTGVLSIGLGGLLPGGPRGVDLGTAVLASRSLFGDEGGQTPDGFQTIDAMGFPAGGFGEAGMPCDSDWAGPLGRVTDLSGWIATVSTCSGTDARARALADRTGCLVENMEGAGVAAAVSRVPTGVPEHPNQTVRFAEIRVISNTTGDRAQQRWDLPRALERLGGVARAAIGAIAVTDA